MTDKIRVYDDNGKFVCEADLRISEQDDGRWIVRDVGGKILFGPVYDPIEAGTWARNMLIKRHCGEI